MKKELDEKLLFLRNYGGERAKHSSGSLLAHLIGTYNLLLSWSQRRTVCDAGLFHSVYGTESYIVASVPLSMRDNVREIIGAEAEELAYLFGIMEKESFYENLFHDNPNLAVRSRLTGERYTLSKQQFIDLCHIMLANWLEQLPRVPVEYQYMRHKEFKAMRPLLTLQAASQLDEAYNFIED